MNHSARKSTTTTTTTINNNKKMDADVTAKPINVTDLASVSMSLPDLPPAQPPNECEVDPFFIAELNGLSMKERDEIYHDVHGVLDVMNENPVTVRDEVTRLMQQLDEMPARQKGAYAQALEQNPSYVHDEEFLLMFLRADRFNVKASALRCVSFFEFKLQLFGRDKLGRDITIGDLSDDDIVCLESGYSQMLSGRDRAGRAIFCLMPMIRKHKDIYNKVSRKKEEKFVVHVWIDSVSPASTNTSCFVTLIFSCGQFIW
jgi:hypothetical protein